MSHLEACDPIVSPLPLIEIKTVSMRTAMTQAAGKMSTHEDLIRQYCAAATP